MPYKDQEKKREYQRKWKNARRGAWFIANGPCVQCGSNKDLELDHIDPTNKVDHKVWSWAEERRNEELKKCQILCSICHFHKSMKVYTKPHGIQARYREGCRCPLCKKANREYKRRRRSQQ